jgi:hypothetical protein
VGFGMDAGAVLATFGTEEPFAITTGSRSTDPPP